MDDNFDESRQISKYNDAQLSISRLHESWVLCKMHIRKGNLFAWKIELDNIWFELFPDVLRHLEKNKFIKSNTMLLHKISTARDRKELYIYLSKRHEFLRGLQDEAGKGGTYMDEMDDGL